jgi:hypothetical protein
MQIYGTYAPVRDKRFANFLRWCLPRWIFSFSLPGKFILLFILLVDISILCFATYSIIDAVEKKVSRNVLPRAVLADYRRPLPLTPAKKTNSLLVDAFTNGSVNALGEPRERFGSYGGALEEAILTADDGSGNFLQLSYDVSSPSSLCGYNNEVKGIDVSRFSRLRFQVRVADGDGIFKIELARGETVKSVSISQLLPDGLSGNWQTVVLPLKELGEGQSALRLTFLFEHDQGMPYRGTVSVRNMRLY